MIQTFYQIGKAIHELPDYADYFQSWGNPFPGREGDALVLVAEIIDRKFVKVYVEAFRKEYLNKYLFKVGSTKGRATNSVPTVPFIDPITSFNKIQQSISSYGHDFMDAGEFKELQAALNEFVMESDKSYLFTFKIDSKYLGEHPEMVEVFTENAHRGFFEKKYSGTKVSKAKEYVCALTGLNTTVYGFVDSLGFTVNDDAFMRNGFDQSDSYKMFPVSPKAAEILQGASALFFSQSYTKYFAGSVKYLILPKFLVGQSDNLISEVFGLFKNKNTFNITSEQSVKGTGGFIKETEKIIDEIIQEDELNRQDLVYDILFFESKQSQLSLLLNVTDVRPSRLQLIMDTKRRVERFYGVLTNYDDGKKYYTFSINLVTIKNFLLTEQGKKKVPHPYFFKIVEAIFYGHQVDQSVFIDFLLKRFRKLFKDLPENEFAFPTAVKEGFVLLQFLNQIQIFSVIKTLNIMEVPNEEFKLNALEFIEQHSDFFDVDFKKGAFLFGCLVSKLLRVQAGNAFLKQLNDLRIDRKLLERRFPPLINKLRQYGMDYKDVNQLELFAAKHMTDQTNVSKDDISFAMTLGMIMQREFDFKRKKSDTTSP